MTSDNKIKIKDLSKNELLDQLKFLLEKVEWNSREIEWMWSYLEETDGKELYDLLFQSFQAKDCPEKEQQNFDKEGIHQLLIERLFNHGEG